MRGVEVGWTTGGSAETITNVSVYQVSLQSVRNIPVMSDELQNAQFVLIARQAENHVLSSLPAQTA